MFHQQQEPRNAPPHSCREQGRELKSRVPSVGASSPSNVSDVGSALRKRNSSILFLSFALLLQVPHATAQTSFSDEKMILKKLFSYTNGPYWANNNNWGSDRVDVCEWFGVTCNAAGYVETINLEDNKLSGTTPRELFSLSHLERINLRLNPVDIKFSNIGQATNLKELVASDSALFQLTHIGQAPSLTSLHLTNNELEGTIPDELYNLTTLEELFLNYNKFTGPLSPLIGQMTNLQFLYLYENQLSGTIPTEMGQLTKLKEVTMSENHFTGTFPVEHFSKLTQLEVLAFQQDQPHPNRGLSGPLPDFAAFPRLSELYLGGNHFSGTIPATFLDGSVKKQELIRVELIKNQLTGVVPATLAQFDNMQLFVRENRFTGIDESLCSLNKWMDGQVADFGCDAILCPHGTSSRLGRQSADFTKCVPCQGQPYFVAPYMGHVECALSEWTILRHFFRDAGGSEWFDKEGWGFEDANGSPMLSDYCSFKGITCEFEGDAKTAFIEGDARQEVGHVSAIALPENNLSGYVPTSIYLLPRLQKLDFKGNNGLEVTFDGIKSADHLSYYRLTSVKLPKGIENIAGAKKLTELHLTDTGLIGELPEGFFSMKNLKVLFMSYNKLGTSIPDDFSKLVNLEQFYCYDCGLTGPIPKNSFGAMQNLKELYLAKNLLTGIVPTDLYRLQNLQMLSLKDNPSLDFSFDGIGRATKLIDLRLSETALSSLDGIGAATSLETLHLTGNDLSGPIPEEIFMLTNLKQLFLNFNRFSGPLPASIGNLKKMTELFLYRNDMTGQLPNEIGDMTDLRVLSLAENLFSGTIPTTIENLKNLNIFALQKDGTVGSTSGITGSLPDFSSMEDLQELYLGGNSLTGSIPSSFLKNSKHIEDSMYIDLTGNMLSGPLPVSLAKFKEMYILLQGNTISEIPSEMCEKGDWMDGDVSLYGCDAILCPVNTASPSGRQDSEGTPCTACEDSTVSKYYGSLSCYYENGDESLTLLELLDTFYHATDGPNWVDNLNWLDGNVTYCEWYGIECDEQLEITAIKLPLNKLSGIVPQELFRLGTMETLDVSDNNVDISFENVEYAVSLKQLRVANTRISSVAGIGKATSLTSIHLDNNHISGPFPEELCDLVNLQHLYFSHNDMTGTIPNKISQLSNLSLLHLYGNNFNGQIPGASLAQLKMLTELDMAENAFTGTLPQELNSLTLLSFLNLHQRTKEASIGGPLLDFAALSQISLLVLDSNALTGTIPTTFLANSAKKADRVVVGLKSNKLSGVVPKELGSFDKLIVDLAGNSIDGIDAEICLKTEWMDGAVADFGCDAILCPPGQFGVKGRQSSQNSPCTPCDKPQDVPFYGSTECFDDGVSSDRDILETFYYKTGGPSWTKRDHWLSDTTPICQWYGVNCTADTADSQIQGKVEKISLEANEISGLCPPEIFLLPGLKHLNLKDNPVKINFSKIGDAKKLEYLKVSGTGLTDVAGISQAQNLQILHLTNNDLSGPIPQEILQMANLKKLFLDYNHFTGTLPQAIGNLKELDELYLFANKLTGQLPDTIGNLENLRGLALSENRLTGSLPKTMEKLSKLELLAIQQNTQQGGGIGGPLPDFTEHPLLSVLYLGPNSFEGTIPETFMGSSKKVKEYVEVDLSFNMLEGSVPKSLQKFDNLEIHLQGNKLSGIPPELCAKENWQDNNVGAFGCDAIMCPPNSFNAFGRAQENSGCEVCGDSSVSEFFGSTSCLSTDQQQTIAEREILKRFYMDTDGSNWRFDANWLDAQTSLCDWYGVRCPRDGRETVEVLYLVKNSLKGRPPPDIFKLPSLKELHLGENTINFSFEGIGQATVLEQLNLDRTGLKSLSGVARLPTLKRLHLRSNFLEGSLSEDLFSLTDLIELDVSDNRLDGELPAGLRNLVNLKSFSCFKNVFSGYIPEWIGDLTALEYVRLDENDFSGTLPTAINDLVALDVFDVSWQTLYGGEGLTGAVPDFANSPGLSKLNLSHNKFSGNIPATLLQQVAVTDVVSVDLRSNKLAGTLPAELSRFERLSIYLSENEIQEIPLDLCDSVLKWMDGNVEEYSCDAILCPPQTFNDQGRQHSLESECQYCEDDTVAPFYGSTECTMSERGILQRFYDATDGGNWKQKSNWMSNQSICKWYGVTCQNEGTEDESVISLDLRKNNLSGSVPDVIFQLSSLKELDLSNNKIDLSFRLIGKAHGIEKLSLDSTSLSSLEGIGEARTLRELHAQQNNFRGRAIPDELFNLFRLKNLYLSASNLSGELSNNLGQLVNLEELVCSDNDLNGSIPASIGKLEKLTTLVLSENDLTGTLPAEIDRLTSLQTLLINAFTREQSGLTGPLPDFRSLSNLTELALGANSFYGTIPSTFLSQLSNKNKEIKVILTSNRLNGTLPVELSSFDQLMIDVADNLIEAIPPKLCEKKNWMRGKVGDFGCDAILCRPGSHALHGRQTESELKCQSCKAMTVAEYYGSLECVVDAEKIKERDILKKFYDTCGGKQWYKKKKWLNDDVDICEWEGLSCHRGKYIDSILMGANNIVGTPPPELFDLPALQWLWLYSNPIDFSFENIGNASSLRSLILDSTGLTSLKGIGKAVELRELDIRFNNFDGVVPEELGLLENIEALSMSDNDFTGPLPQFLQDLTKLRKLRVGSNHFNGKLLSFEKLTQLRSLDVSGNSLSGTIPMSLMAGSIDQSDVFIDLSSNDLEGTVPMTLNRFEDLTIYLKDNLIEAIDPSLCDNDRWNDGNVGDFGCDAILCPMGTYNSLGRQSRQSDPCEACNMAQFYGAVECSSHMYDAKGLSSGAYSLSAGRLSAIIAATALMTGLFICV